MTYKCGLVALSADPLHIGHIYLIGQALEKCSKVVVWVGCSGGKRYTFELEERAQMTLHAIQLLVEGECLDNVKVVAGSGLLVDVALREGCDALFRGIRSERDKVFEEETAARHELASPGFLSRTEVVYVPSPAPLSAISSSYIKNLITQGGEGLGLVTPQVSSRLDEVLCGRTTIGVLGRMGVGKSWVCERLRTELRYRGIATHHICVDELVHAFYAEQTAGAALARRAIGEIIGEDLDGSPLTREYMKAQMLREDITDEARVSLNDIMRPHIARLYREKVLSLRGVLLVEWAMLAENMGAGGVYHNRFIWVTTPDRKAFLEQRNVSDSYIQWADKGHDPDETKRERLLQAIENTRYGVLLEYENRKNRGLGDLPKRVLAILPDGVIR